MISDLFQVILILLLGFLLALIFSVPVKKIRLFYEKYIPILSRYHQLCTVLAVLTCFAVLIGLIFIIFFLFYYHLSSYFSYDSWNAFLSKIKSALEKIYSYVPYLKNIGIENYAASLIQKLMRLPSVVGKFLAGILISFYLLIDWEHYEMQYEYWEKKYIQKESGRKISLLLEKIREILSGYLKGQSMDAVIMGILISVGLLIIKVPLAVPIGILSGVGNLIPYTGPIIAFSLTILFCLVEGKMKTLVIALIYLFILQQIDGSYIGPKLLGKQLKIRPLLVIVSVLTGGTLFGTIGIIFAVPAAATLKYILCFILEEYYE